MRRVPNHALFGPAVLLYLLADAAATQGELDALGVFVAVMCALLALAPLLSSRGAERTGERRVGALGLLLAFALLRSAAPNALSLGVEVAEVIACSGVGVLLVELAATVPDAVVHGTTLVRLGRGLGVGSALLGLAAIAPADLGWVASTVFTSAPLGFLLLAVVGAFALRLARRGLGSAPEALASNAWATLGLLPATAVAALCLPLVASEYAFSPPAQRILAALCAVAIALGHLWLIDPRRRPSTGPALRNLAATTLAVVVSALLAVLGSQLAPSAPLGRGLAIAGIVIFGLLAQRGFARLAAVVLTPARGRLLRAIEQGHAELRRGRDLDELARIVLGAARSASGLPEADPSLHLIDPPLEFRIDAAGIARTTSIPPHHALLSALRAWPGELLLRMPLEARRVRTPALRGLVDLLVERDALCVLPLAQHGELEGLLVIPRGVRTSNVTLEEIDALREFGGHVVGLLALLAGDARLRRRTDDALTRLRSVQAELDGARAAQVRLQLEVRTLREQAAERTENSIVAYGPAMRALLLQLGRAAKDELSVLLWAERGVPLQTLARFVHAQSPRSSGPLVVVDCPTLRPEAMASALVGAGPDQPGLLDRADGGTLVLHELAALGSDAQQVLAAALAARRARVVATSRRAADELSEAGVLRAELRGAFGLHVRVPPLRERKEDISSLLLLALDRAARVLGRETVGVDEAARAALLGYEFPGNEDELDAIVERAVARCSGSRVALAELGPLGAPVRASGNPLDATLERVEHRALRRALERAAGIKSEAARLLGIPRTTLLDKLRRHGLDPELRDRASERAKSDELEPDKTNSVPPN